MAMHLLKIGVGHLCLGCQVAVSAVCAENRSEVCRNTLEYTCAGPAGERARTEVAGVRPDPSDATLTAVTRGRSVGGDCVGPGPAPGVRGAGGGNPVCGAAR